MPQYKIRTKISMSLTVCGVLSSVCGYDALTSVCTVVPLAVNPHATKQ